MILVVGAGMMGAVIARDLSERYEVTVIDTSEESLKRVKGAGTFNGSVSEYPDLEPVELAVIALPAQVARRTVEFMLERGIDVVDISFTDYDPFELDGIAVENGAVYIPHAGFAPGLSNILAGWLYHSEGSRNIEILVGGLQDSPLPPMNYRPTFNASSVIDEYTRPARYLDHGTVKIADPLETVESVEMEGIGLLETFYSDGLATILQTMKDATVVEKTLRHPGHLEKMRFLRDMGYFSDERHSGTSPRMISERIFRDLAGNYRDLSILKVISLDDPDKYFSCTDRFDESSGTSSMGRMTGFSASSIASAVMDGYIKNTGVFATEWIATNRNFFLFVLEYLKKRSIYIKWNGTQIM